MKIIPEKWRGTKMPTAIPAWFWLWAHWRDLGATGPRPKSAPRLIPAWAWVRYLIHRGYKWAGDPPPPPPPISESFGYERAVLFHAGDVTEWLTAPGWYIRALSADIGQDWLNSSLVAAARSVSGVKRVAAWCDCRASGGTDARYAIEAVRKYGLAGWYGQGETAAEFDHALQRGREYGLMPLAIIGNLSALRDDQLKLIRNRDVLFINETYYNVMPWISPGGDWLDVGAGVGGNCVAMYASSTEGATRRPLAGMRAEGLFIRLRDSIYTPGSTPEDVKAA